MEKNQTKIKPSAIVLIIGIVLFIAIVPRVLEGYSMMIMNLALIYCVATYGISIMLGMGGQLTFAAVSFMGAGAYFVANMCSGRLGFWMSTPLALLLTIILFTVISFLIGLVLFKLQGAYFTFATIGLVQVAFAFYQNYRPIFGGPDGISNIEPLALFGFRFSDYNKWFYALVVIVLIVALLVERIRRTQLGRSLASIRDNETAAKTLGVNVYMTKVIAFTIAGVLAALAGALYSMHGQFICSDMFNFERATLFIIMAMLGGVNNSVGIFIGSVLVTILPESLRVLQNYLQLVYGISIIVLMVFMPEGLAGLVTSMIKKSRRKIRAEQATVEGVNR